MAKPSSRKPKSKTQAKQNQTNPRSELRQFVELFSITTIFFLFGIISFSIFSMQEDKTVSFTIHHEWFLVLFCIYILLSLVSLILLLPIPFFTSLKRRLEECLEYPDSERKKVFGIVFWFVLWLSLSLTFVIGLADAANKLPAANWRDITKIAGVCLYGLATIFLFFRSISSIIGTRRLRK